MSADIKDPTNMAAQSEDTSDDYTEFNADLPPASREGDEYATG